MSFRTNISNSDPFWTNDISVLFRYDRLGNFFPRNNMHIDEKLNSLVRLSLYLSLGLSLNSKNSNWFFLFIFTLILSVLMNKYTQSNPSYKETMQLQNNTKKEYVKPTKNNPFMNVLYTDYKDNPNRDSEISKHIYFDNDEKRKEIENSIKKSFKHNLYKDVSDVFGRMNSERQFYTTPITTIPNDQGSFAKWLYGRPKTCKENNGGQCYKNISFKPQSDIMGPSLGV